MLACSYSYRCSGCDWLLLPRDEQRKLKLRHLLDHTRDLNLPEAEFIHIDDGALRDRVDLMISRRGHDRTKQQIGLFDRFKSGIVDLEGCPQLSPQLEAWMSEIRKVDFPIDRGSIRLRVGPNGLKGVWLDFANVDVKMMLDRQTELRTLLGMGIVEIGQRRKRLIADGERLRLAEPVLEPWFETYLQGTQPDALPLFCTIGSFTQPGLRANKVLVNETMRFVQQTNAKSAMEFGSGIGNFTFPLLRTCGQVAAFEVDSLALSGLRKTASLLSDDNTGKKLGINPEKLSIHEGNFQSREAQNLDFSEADLVFVDPPRSGLMQFLDPLVQIARRPNHFVYVSCFTESFAKDARRLLELGYRIEQIKIVDQFPQSQHYETIAHFTQQR
jgi:23S rRNA (uracil1939-C5)-methyltransferase